MKKALIVVACLVVIAFTACSSEPKKSSASETKQAEAPEYITGRSAFQKLFVAGRGFAGDVKPYRLRSNYVKGSPAAEGKAGIWTAYFASPSKGQQKSYTWSGVSGENFPERGVSHSTEDTYNASNSSMQLWDLVYLKEDSDKAFEVAQKHGGDKVMKADPNTPVIYILDFDQRANKLIWHVVYGGNPNEAKLRIAVDASTGEFIRNEH